MATSTSTSSGAVVPIRRATPLLEDGLLTGLVGAGVLAAWFLGIDMLRGTPLITPSVLSAFVFDGVHSGVTVVSTKAVFAYSGLHVILFLIEGWLVALMFSEFEADPDFGTAYLMVYVVFQIVLFGVQIAVMGEVLGFVGTYAVAIGNTLAAIAMFWFMHRRRPTAVGRLAEPWQE